MIKRLCLILGIFLCTYAQGKEHVPRTIISLYSGKIKEKIFWDRPQRLAEMPLNHLGLKVIHYDIDKGLPDIVNDPDVRGILCWFPETPLEDPKAFLDWANRVMDSGKKFVVFGYPFFILNNKNEHTPITLTNQFLRRLGIEFVDEWVDLTYDWTVSYSDAGIANFERSFSGRKPPFERTNLVEGVGTTHLTMQQESKPFHKSHQIVTSAEGGYVADNYEIFMTPDSEGEVRRWYINPFEFFRLAYHTDDLPKPDTTTLNGRRIYYSHIDGDGWNNVSWVQAYKDQEILSSEVLYHEILKKYPDLPVTMAPIVADLDTAWVGTAKSHEIAKKIFALSHVQMGNHTLSHPFMWSFFEDGNAEKERPFLYKYEKGNWAETSTLKKIVGRLGIESKPKKEVDLQSKYSVPRAYANKKFSIQNEIVYSNNFINTLAPSGKISEIFQWSGDTTPFEQALELCEKENLWNINGGDSRFDREFPSYAWVAPIGRRVGKYQQIYSSNSNENTYTDLWQGRFFGFQYLVRTIKNTETPLRIKPFNVYYHVYSGEKDASLNALRANLDYARSSNLIPITAVQFAKLATNFYGVGFAKIAPDTWEITNNKYMDTIRFDRNTDKAVDFEKSSGVLGQKHYQGSLYVFLDPLVKPNVIALKPNLRFYESPQESRYYLLESSWWIEGFRQDNQGLSCQVHGFGTGKFTWYVPHNGPFTAQLVRNNTVIEEIKGEAKGNFAILECKQQAMDPAVLVIKFGGTT